MMNRKFEPSHNNVKRHLISGILNSGVVQLVKVFCQFGSVIFLSRLLPPSDFGIIAMVGPIYGFVTLFQDLGLNQATIQKQSISHDEVNAFFWINVLAGTALAVFIILISPFVGWYYGEPRVIPLTAAMGLLVLVGAIGNQPNAILTRQMQFRAISLAGAFGAISSLAASIIAALIFKNYWALYCGMIFGTIVPVLGYCIAAKWTPSVPRRVSGLRDMLKFGAGITSANFSSYCSRNLDNVLIGWKWGGQDLGLYDRAYKLLLFPIQQVVGPVMAPLVPLLSRINTDPEQYRNILLRTISQLTLIIWPGIIWAAVLYQTLVPTLLGNQWKDASPIFFPLALAGLVQVINYSTGCLYISQGRAGEYARWSFIGAVIDVMSFLIGLPFGAVGVATAYAISEYLRTPLLWFLLTRKGPIRTNEILRAVLPQILSVTFSAIALVGYREYVHFPAIGFLSGGLIISYFVFILIMTMFTRGRDTLQYSVGAGQRTIAHLRSRS